MGLVTTGMGDRVKCVSIPGAGHLSRYEYPGQLVYDVVEKIPTRRRSRIPCIVVENV